MEMIETFLSERGAYVTEFLDKNVDLIIVGQKVAKNELSTRNSTSQSRVHQIIKAGILCKLCGPASARPENNSSALLFHYTVNLQANGTRA